MSSDLQTWWVSSCKRSAILDVYKLLGKDGPGAVAVLGALPLSHLRGYKLGL